MAPKLICIAGGIGSGKSVVSRVLGAMGYAVYDCDSRARTLMDTSDDIKRRISHEISPDCITPSGAIDRPALAALVFADKTLLDTLNKIVHEAVRRDLEQWRDAAQGRLLFVETAIPYTSGIASVADAVWAVTAPEDVRTERIVARSGAATPQQVAAAQRDAAQRIAAQRNELVAGVTLAIVNDGATAVLPQIYHALAVSE